MVGAYRRDSDADQECYGDNVIDYEGGTYCGQGICCKSL